MVKKTYIKLIIEQDGKQPIVKNICIENETEEIKCDCKMNLINATQQQFIFEKLSHISANESETLSNRSKHYIEQMLDMIRMCNKK